MVVHVNDYKWSSSRPVVLLMEGALKKSANTIVSQWAAYLSQNIN